MEKILSGVLAALVLLISAEAFAFSGVIFIGQPTTLTINGVKKLVSTISWAMNDAAGTDGFFVDVRDLGATASGVNNDLKQKCASAAVAAGVLGTVPNDFIIQGGYQ